MSSMFINKSCRAIPGTEKVQQQQFLNEWNSIAYILQFVYISVYVNSVKMMANLNCTLIPCGLNALPALCSLNANKISEGRIYYYYLIDENTEPKGHSAKR